MTRHLEEAIRDADLLAKLEQARGTPGFSGADLANLVNEAALFAARENAKDVRMEHFDKARDKIMMGAERRSMAMSEEEKRNTAYHEAGHAIVGRLVPDHDPVYKVTIIPRGRALGVTMYLPEGDRYSYNKENLESRLCSLYGGRVAEELIFGADKVTTGASNDIERATKMARNMVTKWGLSELGPITYGEEEDEVFLGRSVTQHKNVSDETARKIDEVVRGILDRAYSRTTHLLTENLDKLHVMAKALLEYETIDAPQIDAIMEGRDVPPPRPARVLRRGVRRLRQLRHLPEPARAVRRHDRHAEGAERRDPHRPALRRGPHHRRPARQADDEDRELEPPRPADLRRRRRAVGPGVALGDPPARRARPALARSLAHGRPHRHRAGAARPRG